MKKMLALLAVLVLPLRHLPKTTRLCVGKPSSATSPVSNNDAVGGINPGPLLGARSAEGSRQSSDRTCFLRCRWTRVEWRECHRHSGTG